jgi:HAD superfamily hydrolase (TIGR01450 family)
MPDGGSDPLVDQYVVAMLYLDGDVYSGDVAVAGAAEALAKVQQQGTGRVFVTNNASRTPDSVANHLCRLGVPAEAGDVVTSAQAAAARLHERLPVGAHVLVVGGEGLVEAVTDAGLHPVASADERPQAVVQGFSPDLTWQLLMEACLEVRNGVPWVATNADATLPTPRGEGPGNGALVDVVRRVTGRDPGEVAGKPFGPIMEAARRRAGADQPLVVGDRLDTDIEAAHAAGMDSLLVLTGVTGVVALLAASPERRPTYVGADHTALLEPGHRPHERDGRWCCGAAEVRLTHGTRGGPTGLGRRVSLDLQVDGAPADRTRSGQHSSASVAQLLHAAAAACWQVLDEDTGAIERSQLLAEVRRTLSSWAAPLGWDR